jgi:uncharacterized protein YndB with AHSA1/START domain
MGTGPAGADDLGRLEVLEGRVRVTFTRRFPQPPATVWRSLTEPAHLAAWFPTTVEGERAAGAPLRFAFHAGEAPPFDGEMLVYEPPSLLELRWGDEILRFALDPDGSGSVLRFATTFGELGKAARDGAGWHACLDLLGPDIAGRSAPWSSADRWKQVHGHYVDRFGPEAAKIGPPEEWERAHGSGDTGPER